ncbi:hypothetical protein B0H15DRAFT_248268 [Mycena belliarum]|uniref:Uncharacterized protein n=1 Tax=Mycena belliarum TaxID=1033014 RepID=A0AAD6U875_9AGAR|nr:hypothetical protein B0H15DRAFT_248268 [Mycena belliae]
MAGSGEHPTHLPDLDVHADIGDVDNAAKALSLIVAAFLDDDVLPLDALYLNVEPCRHVLARHADLHAALEQCHITRDFSSVRMHVALRRQKDSPKLAEYVAKLLPALVAFIEDGGLRPWTLEPDSGSDSDTELVVTESVRAHIASLEIPEFYGPRVLLRDLGAFSKNESLASRVQDIFVRGHHTFLVNTSGSGKTRLTFEGLCQEWGFYLVGAVDSNDIGSQDLRTLLELHVPDKPFRNMVSTDPDEIKNNVRLTRDCLRKLLLCRLLAFSVFAEHIHAVGPKPDHKRLWLLVQALPYAVGRGKLGDIFSLLLSMVTYNDEGHIRDYIAHLMAKLRGLFDDSFHIFVVIDEAQAVSRSLEYAYRDEDGGYYPVLREIIDGLDGEFHPHEISFVAAGTQIPRAGFQTSRNVARHRWCSGTGAFDDEDLHREYVSRYLPRSFIITEAGKAFLKLVWTWCRGRYRATDSLMATLLRDGFRSPHTLLNDYVEAATGYRPNHNLEYTVGENEGRERIQISPINFEGLENPSTIQEVLFHYSVTGKHPRAFSTDHMSIISQGFGRFIDDRMSQIVMDEPLMLVAAAVWFCGATPELPSRDSLFDIIRQYPPNNSNIFKTSLVIYLTHAFAQGYPVYKIFTFPFNPPAWAKQAAEIVAIYQGDDQTTQYTRVGSSTAILAATSSSLTNTTAWLLDDSPPFCLPEMTNLDLICALRLKEGTFMRIILKTSASTEILEGPRLRAMVNTLDYSKLFANEDQDPDELPHAIAALHSLPTGPTWPRRPSVLRVVASFPGAIRLKTATNKATRGLARLNQGLYKMVTATIPASTIFGDILEAFLPGTRKRTLPPSSDSGSRKRQKLSQPMARRSGRGKFLT